MLIFVALLTAVHSATVTARFALGRGMVDETQDRMIWKTENAPAACKNIAYTIISTSSLYQGLHGNTYKVAGARIMSRSRQDLADYRSDTAGNNMEAPVIRLSAVPRVRNREEAGEEIRRGGKKEGLDLSEAERLDDSREEV